VSSQQSLNLSNH